MNLIRHTRASLFAVSLFAAAAPSSQAVTLLSQNFDTDPLNYTLPIGSEFIAQQDNPGEPANNNKYWHLSSAVAPFLNPNISGNSTTYLTGQNMDAPLPFTTGTPAQIEFIVDVTGFTDLTLSIDIAGLSMPEPENFVRAFTDNDADFFFETPIFNFQGTANAPYVETTTFQQLTANFATFNFVLSSPIVDNFLRLRLEVFNDTNTMTEAVGIDNILIAGIPEPSTGLLMLTGLLGFARRRRD